MKLRGWCRVMELLRSLLFAFIFAWFLIAIVAIWNAGSDGKHSMNLLGGEHMPLVARSARQIRAEARQRRERAYKERTLKRVEKAPDAHLYVSSKEAEAIRKSGILNGARFDTHVHK